MASNGATNGLSDGTTALPTPLVVASDLHLAGADAAGVARFVAFMDGPAAAAASVVLAGDLFEVWTTPSQARDPRLAPVFDALRRRVAAGTAVAFVEGNRDFAVTPELRALGVRALADVVVVRDGALRVAITHGDRLCRRDVRYQAFRRLVRTQTVRHVLRAVPPSWGDASGRAARRGSAMEIARKAEGDMGLDPLAVADLLRATRADALVCGHVHWGRRHRIAVGDTVRDVVVLGAWDAGDASYARIAGGRVEFLRFGP
jgi:UDP-2,3-diacylglucosamine hydrolase